MDGLLWFELGCVLGVKLLSQEHGDIAVHAGVKGDANSLFEVWWLSG